MIYFFSILLRILSIEPMVKAIDKIISVFKTAKTSYIFKSPFQFFSSGFQALGSVTLLSPERLISNFLGFLSSFFSSFFGMIGSLLMVKMIRPFSNSVRIIFNNFTSIYRAIG